MPTRLRPLMKPRPTRTWKSCGGLKWGNCSDILNFKYSSPFIRYDTLAFHSVIIENIHFPFIEITVNHIFLLIRQ